MNVGWFVVLRDLVTFMMGYWSLLVVPLALIGPCDVQDDLLVTLGLHWVVSMSCYKDLVGFLPGTLVE